MLRRERGSPQNSRGLFSGGMLASDEEKPLAPKQPQIILVDEKELAEACAGLVPGYEWISKNGADYSGLRGRSCVIVGRAGAVCELELAVVAKRLAQAGAQPVKTVAPEPSRPSGWGLDNAIDEGWDGERILEWLRANVKLFNPQKPKRKTLAEIWAYSQVLAQERRKANPKLPIWEGWNLALSNNLVPVLSLANAVTILERDEGLAGLVWFDEFLQRLMTSDPPREWGDADDLHLALYMQRDIGLQRMGSDIVSRAVIAIAHRKPRNCVRDWLDALEHDGKARIDAFFTACLGAAEDDYTRAASRNFWLSMVARVYEPGCKVDNMVVLEGSQGLGKSTALQIIGGDWFAEQHESATNPKGFAEILQGKLLIEISEMDSFNRTEVNRVKQTVSCPSDRYRPSYGHHAQDHLRQCIFVGTTNRDDWNRDETGARRFWPIDCKRSIQLELIRASREQCFAEAVARYKAHEPHWLMPEEATKLEQRDRYQEDPWHAAVAEAVKGELETTTAQVAQKLNIPLERRDKVTEMRIGGCLRILGWKRIQRKVAGERIRIYVKPLSEPF